jgi:hypothetical protein
MVETVGIEPTKPSGCKPDALPTELCLHLAGAKRFELLQTGLESVMLPLHQAPIGLIKAPIHLKP